MKKSAIIIGSGIGGLSTAVRLLSNGYDVTIFEKESTIGGKTNRLVCEPFIFDLTASILMNREIFEEVFTYAGLDYRDYLEIIKIDPTYRCFYPDGTKYDFTSDLVPMVKTLESVSTEDSIGYLKLMSEIYERYTIANDHFLQKSFDNPMDFFNPSSLMNSIKTKAFSTSDQLISKYIKDDKIKKSLLYQSLYVGISPYEGPSIYTLVPAVSQLYGLWHLKGGMYSFVEALEKVIHLLGGKIIKNYDVDEIVISDNKAIGIKAKNQKIVYSDVVVSDVDFPYTMENLSLIHI